MLDGDLAEGKLRCWNNSEDEDFGKVFLILRWRHGVVKILQEGAVTEWHESTVTEMSEPLNV